MMARSGRRHPAVGRTRDKSVRFDWSLLDGFAHPLPWALSGGLDAHNVSEAIRRTRATLVDASSGIEDAPGLKNVDKIAAFLQSVAAS